MVRQRNRKKIGARKYRNYTDETLNAAVDAIKRGMSSRKAEETFHIPRKTLLNKCKMKHMSKIGHPIALSGLEERHIVDVLIACAEFGAPLCQIELCMIVKGYLDKKGTISPYFTDNLPGPAWVEQFIARHKSMLTKRHCQNLKRNRAEVTEEDMELYFRNLERTLEGVDPAFILNYDESNLSDNPGSRKCIFFKGTKYPERYKNFSKSAISLMFSATATGEMLPLYVVYKAERLYDRWLSGGPPKTVYNRTKSGWFDAPTFQDWFTKVVLPWAKKTEGPKVIIGDNLSSHINIDVLQQCQRNNIRFVLLPPNTTHLTQPLDVSFFRPLKAAWRTILNDIKMKQPKLNCVDKCIFPQLLSKLMERIECNSKKNIQSGFRACGIYPFNPDEVYKKMPNQRFENRVKGKIDESFLEYLRNQRKPDKPLKKGTKKTLKVQAGCSLTYEEMNGTNTAISDNSSDHSDMEINEVITPVPSTREQDENRNTENVPTPTDETITYFGPDEIEKDSYVVVQFSTKKTLKYFIGKVTETKDDDQYSLEESYIVKFMRKAVNTSLGYIFPEVDDVSVVNIMDIKAVLSTPTVGRRGNFLFKENLKMFNL